VDLGFVNVAEWARVLHCADALLLVSEPSDLAIGMLVRYLDAVDSAGLERDRFQIVINRSRQNDDATIATHERQLRQTFVAQLPNDYRQVSEAIKLGVPLTTSSNNALIGRYREMASRLMSRSSEESKLSRADAVLLFGR
jgi:MinD superfamily P-loop ATPase